MPATRQYVPLDDAPPAPCDQDCWWWQRCKDERLACWQFESFVTYGTFHKPPKKHEATREVHDVVFGKHKRKARRIRWLRQCS
jgi:hypothetical protein